MNPILLAGILGLIGGLTRGTVGMLKAMATKKKMVWQYWITTVVIACIIGVFVGIVFDYGTKISLLAGYAGTDLLEGIYKSFRMPMPVGIK